MTAMPCPYCMKPTTHDPDTGNFICKEHGAVLHDLIHRELPKKKEKKMKEERIKEIEEFFKVMKEQEWYKEFKEYLDIFNKALESLNSMPKLEYITYVDNKSSCDHVWVLDSSSTCGNTFRCIKCPAYKTEGAYDYNDNFWYDYAYSTHMLGC